MLELRLVIEDVDFILNLTNKNVNFDWFINQNSEILLY